MVPEILQVSATTIPLLIEANHFLESLGFSFEPFGPTSIRLTSAPACGKTVSPRNLFIQIIEAIERQGVDMTKQQLNSDSDDLLADIACKASIRAHDTLSEAEVFALLDQMSTLPHPWQCPHGRPTVIELTKPALEKLFKRIV